MAIHNRSYNVVNVTKMCIFTHPLIHNRAMQYTSHAHHYGAVPSKLWSAQLLGHHVRHLVLCLHKVYAEVSTLESLLDEVKLYVHVLCST